MNLAEILETLAWARASRAHGFRTAAVHTVLHTGWVGEGWRPGDFRLPEDTAMTDSLDAWAQHCTIAQHITLADHQPVEP
ncbi:hypothetical protein [Parenemella sanctibonifatiensis]|uniref:Uncharacterized protein n=1 Tax=Parenemella sanctibonifatiensis TaxID=2016505 RepID=A0A255ECR4_9ACTN|nr:hypothetical protein [Parenemella sanctibonifatiensis]OYN89348.1 hypothetical protein CGZ91_10615 [Parenemella sanctibonifatiensis]